MMSSLSEPTNRLAEVDFGLVVVDAQVTFKKVTGRPSEAHAEVLV